MSKGLFWTNQSILLLTSPLLVLVTLFQVNFTPTTFMFQNALFIRMADLILIFVLSLAGVVGLAPLLGCGGCSGIRLSS